MISQNKSRIREYDAEERPSVFVPDYLKGAGLENIPGLIYFWMENEDDVKLKDIYSEKNERLANLTYSIIMPRVIAVFDDGSEAWSGSVDKGTKIYLKVGETPYDQFDYEIQYTLNGAYPGKRKDNGSGTKWKHCLTEQKSNKGTENTAIRKWRAVLLCVYELTPR